MRVRSTVTGGFSTSNYRAYQTRSSCVAAWVTNSGLSQTSFTGTTSTKTIEDVQTAGFHSLRKCGKFLPLNPVEIVTTTETREPGTGDHNFSLSGGCFRIRNTGPLWLSRTWLLNVPPVDEDLVDQVATNAIADCKAGIHDALTDLVEIRQTAGLIGTQFNRINAFAMKAAKLARDIRRGRVKQWLRGGRRGKAPPSWLDTFSQLWLEYRYGWRPLIKSVEDMIAALQSKLKKGDIVRGSGSVTVDLSDAKVTVTTPTAWTTRTEDYVISGSRTYRGKAYAEINTSQAVFQFDPLVTAWESIPYSFIVDWALQVGNWLQAITPFSGAILLGSQVSVKDSYTRVQKFDEVYNDSQHQGAFHGLTTTVEVESYLRFPHGAGTLPSWNLRLNPSRILDLVALVLGGRSKVMRYAN